MTPNDKRFVCPSAAACEMESLLVSDTVVRNGLVDVKTNVAETDAGDRFGNSVLFCLNLVRNQN